MAYRVQVYESQFVNLIQVGDGDRWLHGKAKQIEIRARAIAPKRSGRLASSHVTLPTRGTNQYVKRYRISAMAPYAHFVHGGTGIYGPRGTRVSVGRWMRIPGANPRRPGSQVHNGKPASTVVWSHRGQKAQPWLERAALDVLGV